jgi:ATP-dependent DNA helicase PIF1
VAQQWKKCKHLIIDEVSMVDGNYFKKLEAVAKSVRGNDKPFGGIQLIMTGDFLQLPPVAKKDERRFAFETSAWSRCNLLNINLTCVKRQSDEVLVGLLNRLREGQCTKEDTELLRGTRDQPVREGIVPTKLCTHTADVMRINEAELVTCDGVEQVYTARDSDPSLGKFLDSHTPVERAVRLRVGAQVMLMKNIDVGKGLVNGARGRVEGFTKEGNPMVVFIGGTRHEVEQGYLVTKCWSLSTYLARCGWRSGW